MTESTVCLNLPELFPTMSGAVMDQFLPTTVIITFMVVFKASRSDPPIGAVIVLKMAKNMVQTEVKWDDVTAFDIGKGVVLSSSASIMRYLVRLCPDLNLYGVDALTRTEIDHWLSFSQGALSCHAEFEESLSYLNSMLLDPNGFLVGKSMSAADYAVFGTLQGSGLWLDKVKAEKAPSNVAKWFHSMARKSEIKQVVAELPKDAVSRPSIKSEVKIEEGSKSGAPNKTAQTKDEGKFVDLPGAEKGKVVVRFPPEASGGGMTLEECFDEVSPSSYLHIGHAKAALLNQHYRDHFDGKLILRFDDTNPAKEKEEFEEVILHDLKLLQVKHDFFSRSSDHFETLLKYCEKLLKEGKAYVDDTDAETMKQEREARQESKNRNNSPSENLKLWEEMKRGTDLGQKCAVRAKIDMKSDNGCLRDPTIYRCKLDPHPATGDKYKVYPTYDFACPIVDSIEGVTHSLRTTEYMDRDDQFFWFINALGLRRPHIYAYARLNMTNTVMSKRKLTWFVNSALVQGWDDPRFPTVRGMLRRGLTIQALKNFIVAQGSSRSVVFMEWDKIWAMNKKVIDPIAPRYTTVTKEYTVPVTVTGAGEELVMADLHPKDPSLGQKPIWRAPTALIDGSDAEAMREGENVTFINWGNLLVVKITKGSNGRVTGVTVDLNLKNKDFKKTLKVTWLAATSKAPTTPTTCVYYDHIISKPVLDKEDDFQRFIGENTKVEVEFLGDPELRKLKKGSIVQIQRRGFFIVDEVFSPPSPNTCKARPVKLIAIPDGTPGSYGPPGKKANKTPSSAPAKKQQQHDTAAKVPSGEAESLSAQITNQGDVVRKLKAEKADKSKVQAQVHVLLELKKQYKAATGLDWTPQSHPPQKAESPRKDEKGSSELNESIKAQGDVVRKLKAEKADKSKVQAQVDLLLDLKKQYKAATGVDWTPQSHPPQKAESPRKDEKGSSELNESIKAQGDVVRKLKAEKADKSRVQAQVHVLLELKKQYKAATGLDWTPQSHVPQKAESPNKDQKSPTELNGSDLANADEIASKIAAQGDVVRQLKASKAEKEKIQAEVNTLLKLKLRYKEVKGEDWVPSTGAKEKETSPPKKSVDESLKQDLLDRISTQGNLVRKLKNEKADAADIEANVKILNDLKGKYKEKTGEDWIAPAGSGKKSGKNNKNKKEQQQTKTGLQGPQPQQSQTQKQTRLGMEARKEESLADWYSQVIVKAEMLEYYDVSGCYILRPWAFAIWEEIQNFFDAGIKGLGVSNCYFPMFVSQSALQKEKDHIADFAPEVAWVTKSGDTDLAEPIAVRPTSETVMYPTFAKWIQSYRDLPIKVNQWCNVVRWEFKHPQPFLRTREFLWQEGHTAYADKAEAQKEVLDILNLYAQVYEDLLAVPVVRGRKTEKEKFAGGDYTTTVEAYISAAGRAIQGATSHHLGQNFSKMFEVVFDDPDTGEKRYVYQNSWGITTRTIGVLTMVHGDNKGLVLPPRVAKIQVVIVPCGITVSLKEEERQALYAECKDYEDQLRSAGIRVSGDYRENYSPGWKFNHWELKGVPVRLEVGPRDVKNSEYVAVRRDMPLKLKLKKAAVKQEMPELLKTIQADLFTKAKNDLDSHISLAENWTDFMSALEGGNLILAPYCGLPACEEEIKDLSKADADVEPGAPSMGAKTLCSPFDQPKEIVKGKQKCIKEGCARAPKLYTLFGRSY